MSLWRYEENFFFIFRDDGVFYNELETRVRSLDSNRFFILALSGSFEQEETEAWPADQQQQASGEAQASQQAGTQDAEVGWWSST